MATKDTEKDLSKDKDAKGKTENKKSDSEALKDALDAAPQTDPNYRPDQVVLTDNRRSDYDQEFLDNPDSQKITRNAIEDGGEGDKPENHEGDKAWDINVKEDDDANRKDAEKVVLVNKPTEKKDSK